MCESGPSDPRRPKEPDETARSILTPGGRTSQAAEPAYSSAALVQRIAAEGQAPLAGLLLEEAL